jgi:hypothetical protein
MPNAYDESDMPSHARPIRHGDMYRCADRGTHDWNGFPWGYAKYRAFALSTVAFSQLCPSCCHEDGTPIATPMGARMAPYVPLPTKEKVDALMYEGDVQREKDARPADGSLPYGAFCLYDTAPDGSFFGVSREKDPVRLSGQKYAGQVVTDTATHMLASSLWRTDDEIQAFIEHKAETCPGCVECEGPQQDGDPTCPKTRASRVRVSNIVWDRNENGWRDRCTERARRMIKLT